MIDEGLNSEAEVDEYLNYCEYDDQPICQSTQEVGKKLLKLLTKEN